MITNVIITDNFYSNPDGVRNFALSQPFSVTGNFPGKRTISHLTPDVKETIQSIVWNAGGAVTDWFENDGYTGAFQLTTAADRSWVHSDHFNTWAGVCYLNPDAPYTGGTGLFRHRATGAVRAGELTTGYEAQDMTKWDLYDTLGNIYNRLVLYRGDLFHSSLDYFGSDLYTGRLFQVFFFSTQY